MTPRAWFYVVGILGLTLAFIVHFFLIASLRRDQERADLRRSAERAAGESHV